MIDLFNLKIRPERAHPQFTSLQNSPLHGGARDLINAAFSEMGDPNGNFVRDFQGHGFHNRLFELSCFSYLRAAGLELSSRHERPDFIGSRDGLSVAIEVTSANPRADADPDISLLRMEDLTEEEVHRRAREDFPQRMMKSLRKKLQHRYHELPHVAGKPLILMVAPSFEAAPGVYVDESLVPAFYPAASEDPEAAFFARPDASAISAVAYCNSFSVSKFLRLSGSDLGAFGYEAVRWGVALFDDEPDFLEFRYRVGDDDASDETWPEGVTLFLNPNADTPLPEGFLPASSSFACEGQDIYRRVIGFHPVNSFMFIQPASETAGDEPATVE
jgi:hypothetical protein